MTDKPVWLAVLVAGISFLALACGGDSSPSADKNGGSGRASSEEIASGLSDLRSFRFEAVLKLDADLTGLDVGDDILAGAMAETLVALLSDIEASGAFVAPDSFELLVQAGSEEIGLIQIGDRSWVKFGATWLETTGTTESLQTELMPEGIDLAEGLALLLDAAEVADDEVNGRPATRYSIDEDSLASIAGAETDLQGLETIAASIWVSETGVPIMLELSASGDDGEGGKASIELSLRLSDVNDASLEILPPTDD